MTPSARKQAASADAAPGRFTPQQAGRGNRQETEMTEADYMNDCHHADRWGDDNRPEATHEVVDHRNNVLFKGSRAACWKVRRDHGGFVREATDDQA